MPEQLRELAVFLSRAVKSAIEAVAEFSPEVPYWPQLPRLSERESIIGQGLGIMADLVDPRSEGYGFEVRDGRIDSVMEALHKSSGNLTPENAAGFHAFEAAMGSAILSFRIGG